MYEPPLHRNEDLPALQALIKERVFGLLISNGPEGLVANSVPFVLDASASRLTPYRAAIALRVSPRWTT